MEKISNNIEAEENKNIIPLSHLKLGAKAMIYKHEESAFRLIMLEMGCIPGEPICVEMVAPFGDPIAIRIAGYNLSIRKADAEHIWVQF